MKAKQEGIEALSQDNSAFWDELCGSSFAHEIGIVEVNKENLKKFDEAFFRYYPYLKPYLGEIQSDNKIILEIGLGYGTVGQDLATHAKSYTGVDIANGPVAMMNYRLADNGLQNHCHAEQGNALDLKFPDQHFDQIVSIGCLHHTGNLKLALEEVQRVCKPGGLILFMAYNRYSLRTLAAPLIYLFCRVYMLFNRKFKVPSEYGAFKRWQRDSRMDGSPPPATEFITLDEIGNLFSQCEILKKEIRNLGKFKIPGTSVKLRHYLLGWFDRILGLDIYVIAKKN